MKTLLVTLCLLPSLLFAGAFNKNITGSEAVAKNDVFVDNSRNTPVGRAFAPSNKPTSDCLMSGGLGGQKSSFAVAIGTTWQSKPCNIRAYAGMFSEYPDVRLAILCQDKIVRTGVEAAGYSCPTVKKTKKKKKCDYPRSDQCRK